MTLSAKELKKYRTLLEGQRNEITTQLDRLQAENVDVNQDEETGVSNHPADEASNTFLVERNLAVGTDLEQELSAIDRALARVDDGSYGMCEVDGEPIDPARLEARPAATLCVAHQQERDQQEHLLQ